MEVGWHSKNRPDLNKKPNRHKKIRILEPDKTSNWIRMRRKWRNQQSKSKDGISSRRERDPRRFLDAEHVLLTDVTNEHVTIMLLMFTNM